MRNPESRIQARMRVGVNTLFLIPGEVGGSETYVRDVLTHAIPANPDLEWVLFTNRENHEALGNAFGALANVRCCALGFSARSRVQRIIREQIQLPVVVKREGIDVLWSPGYTAPVLATCPQVVSILDMQYKAFPQDLSLMALWATRLLVPLAARRADRVLTLSEFSRTEILKYIRIPGERVQVIYPAADGVFSRVVAGGARRAVVPEGAYVLCVANTYPHKNVHTLIQAMDMVWPRHHVSLVLVGGEGRGEPVVRAAISRLGNSGGVIRLRGLSRDDLVALYQGASVFVFPSLYEGFGLPVLEAMAAGVPVLALRCGSIPEVGGESIRYFDGSVEDCARGVEELVAMAVGDRERMVGEARERAASFSWERTADEVVSCLRRVAGND